jgi:peptide/nickel transport system substrate-binding protein
MVEGHEVAEDGLTWNLTLRDGLRFHDKEPVPARDVVASIRRFPPRAIFAAALMDATDELSAPDDRSVRFRLKRPFPHLPQALAGPGGNAPAIMPERLAKESSFKPVAEIVGSGPYRFLKDEQLSGAAQCSSGSICNSRATPRVLAAMSALPPARRWRILIASSG